MGLLNLAGFIHYFTLSVSSLDDIKINRVDKTTFKDLGEISIKTDSLVQNVVHENSFIIQKGKENTYWRNITDGRLIRKIHKLLKITNVQ